ncbi:MAG: hypothetical protein ABIH03_09740, partial [Pseudomonadota bacterium]
MQAMIAVTRIELTGATLPAILHTFLTKCIGPFAHYYAGFAILKNSYDAQSPKRLGPSLAALPPRRWFLLSCGS